MKRFWDRADYAEVPGGFAIMLDGKPLRLPGVDGRAAGFVLPGRPLAEAELEIPKVTQARLSDSPRDGEYSEYRGYILAEMQSLARKHPGAKW